MFYRRKVILALIELLGGEIEKIRFQKLLFLYSMRKQKPEYDFVPYKYGCYSYSANADMQAMARKEVIKENESKYSIANEQSFFELLKPMDQRLLKEVVADYGGMSSNSLIKHTYLNFPFYAINSAIVNEVLSEEQYEKVIKAKPKNDSKELFTIGYEGISLEFYLQKLLRSNIHLLVDVRRNPLSMKFGFSKSRLKKYCNSLGIEYVHLPQVGISSDKRTNLKDQSDYDALFEDYCKTTLVESQETQGHILELLDQYNRIALTCFEAEFCHCHRSHLATSLLKYSSSKIQLSHI